MHISTFATLFTLAVAASSAAAAKKTYIKLLPNEDVEQLVGWESTDEYRLVSFPDGGGGPGPGEVVINNDTTITIMGMGLSLDAGEIDTDLGYSNLTVFSHPLKGAGKTPSPGFSWSENGTLLLDNDKYHGWVHCPQMEFSLYLAAAPIKALQYECRRVHLVKHEE